MLLGDTVSFFVHNDSFGVRLWFTAIMIKSAFRAEQFAFAAVKFRTAVHAIVPVMIFGFNLKLFDLELQQRWYFFDIVPVVLHCATNLTK